MTNGCVCVFVYWDDCVFGYFGHLIVRGELFVVVVVGVVRVALVCLAVRMPYQCHSSITIISIQ